MAMRFSQAQRAENPDLAAALANQTAIANQLKAAEVQAEAQERGSLYNAGANFAAAAPEGTFTNAWDTATGGGSPTLDFSTAGMGSEALGGEAIASGITPELTTALGSDALTAEGLAAGFGEGGGAMGAALGGGEAALGSEALAAGLTEAGVAGTAAGGGGTAALASMGPMGWAALAAIGAGLFG